MRLFTYVYVRVLNTRQWTSFLSFLSTPYGYVGKKNASLENSLKRVYVIELYIYIYTWEANCQSKSEAKNGGHGAFLDISFRPLRGHPGCHSQMVSGILIGRWPRRGLKLTSRSPPCRPCLASLFRPMIDGSWPSRYIYIIIQYTRAMHDPETHSLKCIWNEN